MKTTTTKCAGFVMNDEHGNSVTFKPVKNQDGTYSLIGKTSANPNGINAQFIQIKSS